ncbi:hypothetical protein [Burkholderia gladioli]|uniref:hypothetical protein n=1 Tax=Burkholderia gladioli TaxID=28095 RepID=UPI0012D351EB|nr:hypothetical protein [Burkholderia gladioli]
MEMICQSQLGQILFDSALLSDERIRSEVEKRIENVRDACGAISSATSRAIGKRSRA